MGEFETIETGGATARVYVAGDVRPGAAGVVVLHPWWGLNDDVIAYVERLAAEGYAIVAPDMFGGEVATGIDDADRLSSAMTEEVGKAITLAAVDRLAERLGPDAPLAALGFSFGAAWSIWAPTERDRVLATVVYYGTWVGSVLGRAKVPVLGHFAEDDPYEDAETVAALEQGLKDAGRDVTIHRYPGTGHWFAEPSRDAYRAAAADLAFERTVAFLRSHLQAARPVGPS
ncbi:MAG TPA: dienelactone hydrolase family protein [Candidatus Limnocylindrales bacterium]|nr:dienelactone hydrolase family protein [Candidatus Limnocylindrales bacterium]